MGFDRPTLELVSVLVSAILVGHVLSRCPARADLLGVGASGSTPMYRGSSHVGGSVSAETQPCCCYDAVPVVGDVVCHHMVWRRAVHMVVKGCVDW